MLQEYFNNSVETTFLKSLLSASQLPKYKIVKDGDLIFENYFYIYNDKLIKCVKTGKVNVSAEILILEHYYFCNMDQNIEFKEFIRASYYSTELHKRLGEYLRCIRDLYGIDLMGMYNCFSYELFNDFHIEYYNGKNRIFVGKDNSKKILAVPIKFNAVYSVYLQSD